MQRSWINLVFLAHLAATLFMVGLIWFVQMVHYPLFSATGSTEFVGYHAEHMRWAPRVVIGPMLAEMGTGLVLLWRQPTGMRRTPFCLGFVLLLVIWLSTAFWQWPQHAVLEKGLENEAYRFLVLSNWMRTVCWSLRACLLLYLLGKRWH